MEQVSSNPRKSRKTRKIASIKPSKYEGYEAIHSNKRYWKKVFDEIDTSISVPTEITKSKHLSKILPDDLYKKVCETLDIPIISKDISETKQLTDMAPRRLVKKPLLSYRKALYVDREMESDTDVEYDTSDNEDKPNIFQEFLKKPEREQITWNTHYLKPERDDEKTLVKKADDLTDNIVEEFCQYMKQLGGNQQSQLFTPKAIKELFQIEFNTHAARSLLVVPKEMPSVIERIAQVTGNPEKSQFTVLEREVARDIAAEQIPDNLLAFGTSLPRKEQWRAIRNDTKNIWRSARHVPKDLVTLKTVWEGITNLRSVREYCRWMIDHPEHRRAPYLSSLGMFDKAVLEARLTFEIQASDLTPPPATIDSAPEPIENIRERLSELAESH